MEVTSNLIAKTCHAPTECLLQPIEVSTWSVMGAIITQHTMICTPFGMTTQAGGAGIRTLEGQCESCNLGAIIFVPGRFVWRREYCVASLAITLSTFVESIGNPTNQEGA
jgi:hypothetical protein